VQLRRDRLTFAMMVGVPIMQLVLFGYAINGDPRHLPTAVVALDNGPLVRSIVRAAENTGYFRVTCRCTDEPEAERLLAAGRVQFALVFPADFSPGCCAARSRRWRSTPMPPTPRPPGSAVAALQALPQVALVHDLKGPLARLQPGARPSSCACTGATTPKA
jgi:ABC-2 type transport system permease protein